MKGHRVLASDRRKFQIGDYVVDTARFRITHGDTTVAVEPKVFDLLVHLIRHRDRVLTREQLFEAVWDGREVSDATLSNHVASARKALGDSGELQRTIRTVRGRGYQFVAPVVEIVDEPTSAAAGTASAAAPAPTPARAPVTGSPVEPPRRTRRLALALVAVALLVPVLFLGARFLNGPSAQPEDSGRPYILVVPFGVSDNATEYHRTFADQVTREVVDNLRKISGLRTVPHASAFHFRTDKSRVHILESLPDLQFLLDGEVSVAPDGTLRVTPRLTDLHRDVDVWSSPFTVRVDNRDFFETPAGIASAVARALKVQILGDEQRALAELPRIPQAYEPYAAGWREMEKFTHESMQRAVEYFDEAIALDPDFIAAYQAKSEALRSIFAYFESPQELLPVVEASLAAVLERDQDSAEALSSLGLTQVMAWKWREAWQNLNKARALDPTLAQTEIGFALYYTALGENEKVKASLARAVELDPLNSELADWGTWALFMVGERQAAREWADKQMRQHPENGFVFCGAGVAAYLRGDTADSVALLEHGVELSGRAPVALIMLAQGYGYAGQKDKVLPLLEEAERANIYMCPYETAAAHLSLGDEASRARAIELLFEAVEKRSNCLIFLRVDPRLRVLRDDPRHAARFQELLTLVGLDESAVRSYRR
ncbi:MAG: winged helix-turn-helix domain-containing protein [Steroidobacteraceae bacterium]|nr:winged helix-turn-helix domain-containing protein [Steroidobacteraceae bacterium]